MPISWNKLKVLLAMKVRFAMTGAVATAVDYLLYLLLVSYFFSPVVSNLISFSIAVVLNFLMQKRFVFLLQRSFSSALLGSLLVSAGGLTLSTAIIYALSQSTFFDQRQYITKLCATGVVFFYNFYLKRFVFEKRFI
ncbi:MAG: GtrA family protein [Saprospiraceae bacterium]|nr:GtrA family protein [Saprospiraceae bacterium]